MIRRAAKIVSRLPGFFRHVQSIRNQRDSLPRMLTYTVTFRCNARCIMCDSWKMSGEGDLSLEEIQRLLQQLPTMDVVRLTGGEPFVRTDLPEIVALVQKHIQPLWLHITSNGFLTDRIRTQSFDEVWGSQRADAQRNWVRNCVGCWAECEILPSAIYSMDLLRKSAIKRTF